MKYQVLGENVTIRDNLRFDNYNNCKFFCIRPYLSTPLKDLFRNLEKDQVFANFAASDFAFFVNKPS